MKESTVLSINELVPKHHALILVDANLKVHADSINFKLYIPFPAWLNGLNQ